jgi:hypothetical protein
MRKRRLKVDPAMIDELFTKKRSLFRSASTEALIRERDVLSFQALNPARGYVKKMAKADFDLRSVNNKNQPAELDSQRS